ncbi:hypothetical protein Taro_026515 [Colocasia esculenta]|uniref:Uncharacterized protein n=1 Tax=Colocasia esculenta TaxID=4460 RepID=A0A843VHD6_COLES|nr:hypothetical protein [Colocasia esculenta]
MEHLVVYLPTDVAATVHVATSVEALPRVALATRCPVASAFVSWRPSPSRWYRDNLWGHDSACECLSHRFGMVLVVLPRLFARCLALEGLSRSEVFRSVGGGTTLGVPGEGSKRSGRYSWYQSEESAEISSVVARRVRAVAARSALDSLAVVFLVWRTLASQSSSGEVLLEFFSVGSGGNESGALVVLVEVLPGLACVASTALLAIVFSLMVRVVWSFGLCILVKATVVLLLWFEVCRLVGLRSGEVLPEQLLAPLVEVLPKAAMCSWWSGECRRCLAGCASYGSVSLTLWLSLSRVEETRCVRISFLCFCWLLEVVMLHCGVVSPGCASQRFGVVLVVLPCLFARCLALEGLSRSEVVSISWDPHPQDPVEGGIRDTSVLELAAYVFLIARACTAIVAWLCLVSMVVVRLALVPAALAGEGLVIPTRPCLRGSPPYFLQLGARCCGSSASDGLRRRLWRRVVVSSSESECCGSTTLGVPGEGSERSGRYNHRCNYQELRTGRRVLNVTALGVAFWLPPRSGVRLHVRHVSCAWRA